MGCKTQQASLEMGGHSVDPCLPPGCGQASALRHASHLTWPDPDPVRGSGSHRGRPPALFSGNSRRKKVKTGRAFPGRQPRGEPTGWALRSPDRLPRPQHAHTPRGTASRLCTPHSSSGSKALQAPGSACVLLCEGKQPSAPPSSAPSLTQQAFVALVWSLLLLRYNSSVQFSGS